MIIWQEILSRDHEELHKLIDSHAAHPLAIEDCEHRDQRAKLDDYGSHQLVVWFLFFNSRIYELQFLIFNDRIICVPHEPCPAGHSWSSLLRFSPDQKDVWHAFYHVLDHLTDLTWIELRKVFAQVDDFEISLFKTDPPTAHVLKRLLNQVDFAIGHLPSVAEQLKNLCRPVGSSTDELNLKFRDLHDHAERINKSISLYRAQISTNMEMLWIVQAQRTNNQIKRLSVLASIALPLTFWSSFWGMNFQFLPFHAPELFALALVVMGLSVAATLWWLVKRGLWTGK
jgi:magnesium transporter